MSGDQQMLVKNGDIRNRLLEVRENIHAAAHSAGRQDTEILLVAVSKKQPVEKIREYLAAGGTVIGENYVEEALSKRGLMSGVSVEWHMIGHIQSRKSAMVAENFDFIQSMDSLKLARRVQDSLRQINKRIPYLLEINIGSEESKSGYRIDHDDCISALYLDLDTMLTFTNLAWRGIMVMPPLGTRPESSRPYFQKAREILETFQKRFPEQQLDQLSMGTSLDYGVAITEGSTMVRIGTAIFGERV